MKDSKQITADAVETNRSFVQFTLDGSKGAIRIVGPASEVPEVLRSYAPKARARKVGGVAGFKEATVNGSRKAILSDLSRLADAGFVTPIPEGTETAKHVSLACQVHAKACRAHTEAEAIPYNADGQRSSGETSPEDFEAMLASLINADSDTLTDPEGTPLDEEDGEDELPL